MSAGGPGRVAIVADTWGAGVIGGGPSYVEGVVRELVRRGREVTVIARGEDPRKAPTAGGGRGAVPDVPVVAIDADPGGEERALVSALERVAPQVAHLNGLKAAAVAACRTLGIPHLLTAHHVGLVCPAGVLLHPDLEPCPGPATLGECVRCANRWRRPRWGAGRVLGSLPPGLYRALGRRLAAKARLGYLERGLVTPWLVERGIEARRRMLQDVRMVAAPSRYVWTLLGRHGVPPERLRLVRHGVEPAPGVPPVRGEGPVRFGYVGRIDPLKGLHLLAEAARALGGRGRCEVHVFGATRNARDEAYRARALGAAGRDVKLVDHGALPPARIVEAYAGIDVVVVPSLVPEAFGLVVAEAFAARRPVVVFDAGALAEQVREGVDGFVVRGRTAAALEPVLRRFVEDRALAAAMSRRVPAVKGVREHVDELEGILGEIARA